MFNAEELLIFLSGMAVGMLVLLICVALFYSFSK